MKMRHISRRASLALSAATVLLGGYARAATTPVTFAEFSESTTDPNANLFDYTDNGAGSAQLDSAAGGIPVVFDFLTLSGGLPSDLQGPQDATLTLTTTAAAGVTQASLLGQTIAAQPINTPGTLGVLMITRDTPALEGANGRTLLLEVDFTGTLAGLLGTRVPVLQGSTASPTDNIVNYSSDFLDFGDSTSNDFNVAFSSWNSIADDANDGNGLSVADDNNFETANAAGAGTFDTTIGAITIGGGVPEPSSLSLIAVGATAMLARRRRAAR